MSEQLTLKEYVEQEKARQEKERAEWLEAQGYRPFVKWPQGVTEFTLEAIIPRDNVSFGKDVKVFSVIVDGEEFGWSINPKSPMYGDTLDLLLTAPVDLKINRLGEGLETRYSLI